MTEKSEAEEAFALGNLAGIVRAAQALECPYPHALMRERQAWLDGFSAGRASLEKEIPAVGILGAAPMQERRPVPYGSRLVYHHSTRTIAIDFHGQLTVLGPFENEDAAVQAAFGFVEMKRARAND